MSQTTACMIRAAEFKKTANQMAAMASAPIRMMNTLNGMIVNAALKELQTSDKMFDDLAKTLGLTAIEDAMSNLASGLTALKNCTGSLGNNPLIQAALGTDLASLSHGFGAGSSVLNIAGHARKYAQNVARKNALAMLDKGMSAFGLGGQLGNTQMRYAKMLKSAGITDSINAMNSIAACMSSLCPLVDGMQATIDKGLSDLTLTGMTEEGDAVVGDLWASADAGKKSAINDTVARGAAIEARINNWSGGLF